MNLRKESDNKQIGTVNSQLRVVNCVIVIASSCSTSTMSKVPCVS